MHTSGIVNLIHAFNLQAVIVGGYLVFLGELFFSLVFARVQAEAMGPLRKGLELRVRDDETGTLRGASAVAAREVPKTFNIKGYVNA